MYYVHLFVMNIIIPTSYPLWTLQLIYPTFTQAHRMCYYYYIVLSNISPAYPHICCSFTIYCPYLSNYYTDYHYSAANTLTLCFYFINMSLSVHITNFIYTTTTLMYFSSVIISGIFHEHIHVLLNMILPFLCSDVFIPI